jgi:hypothetical protein
MAPSSLPSHGASNRPSSVQGLRAAAVTVYAPSYGRLRLVVTRNRHGNHDYLVTSELGADLTTVTARKQSRWSVEMVFPQLAKGRMRAVG